MRLFDADLALAVIHSFQPSFCPFYSTPGSALSLDLYSPKFLSFFYKFAYSLLSFALPFLRTYICYFPPPKKPFPFVSARVWGRLKKDTEESKDQITKADRRWARPKTPGTAAVVWKKKQTNVLLLAFHVDAVHAYYTIWLHPSDAVT